MYKALMLVPYEKTSSMPVKRLTVGRVSSHKKPYQNKQLSLVKPLAYRLLLNPLTYANIEKSQVLI